MSLKNGAVNMAWIYEIRNKLNKMIYIGSTKNLEQRWNAHLYGLRNGEHFNNHLQSAWNKYGEDNFEFIPIEEIDDDKQYYIEQEYINKYRKLNQKKKIIYNLQIDVYNPGRRETVIKRCGVLKNGRPVGRYWDYCGKEFEAIFANQKYCADCSEKYRNNYQETMDEKNRNNEIYEFINYMTSIALSKYQDIDEGERSNLMHCCPVYLIDSTEDIEDWDEYLNKLLHGED